MFDGEIVQDDLPEPTYQVVAKCTICEEPSALPIGMSFDRDEAMALVNEHNDTMTVDDEGEVHNYKVVLVEMSFNIVYVPPKNKD